VRDEVRDDVRDYFCQSLMYKGFRGADVRDEGFLEKFIKEKASCAMPTKMPPILLRTEGILLPALADSSFFTLHSSLLTLNSYFTPLRTG
jgi:hypothetical protein